MPMTLLAQNGLAMDTLSAASRYLEPKRRKRLGEGTRLRNWRRNTGHESEIWRMTVRATKHIRAVRYPTRLLPAPPRVRKKP